MIDISMWGKALRTIPRLNKAEWDKLDIIARWLIASRAAVFVMTALSAAIGGLMAFADGTFHWPYFLAAFFGLIFAHASNNLINDLIDHRKGIDKDNYYRAQYGLQPLEHGLMKSWQFNLYIAVTLFLSLACGAYLVWQIDMTTFYFLLGGLFFVLFYTWPLKYIGLGEPSVILVWGPLMVGGTYYVTAGGSWSWDVAVIGLVYALGPTTVLFGKHIDKLREDKRKKVRTLPVIIGQKAARYTTIAFWVIQYLLLAGMVIFGYITPLIMVVLLALPKFFRALKRFARPRPGKEPADLEPGVWPLYLSARAFQYNKKFGSLFLLGLIIEVVLSRLGVTIF